MGIWPEGCRMPSMNLESDEQNQAAIWAVIADIASEEKPMAGMVREHTDTDCGPAQPAPTPAILPKGWIRENACSYRHRSGLLVLRTMALERDGKRWLHVSLSAAGGARLPTYDELVAVKEVFICASELPNVLHLWHCLDGRPTPDFRRGGTI